MSKPDWEGFCRAILLEAWPGTYDIEACEVFNLAKSHNLIRQIPGGFDPELHGPDDEFGAEPGDDWYECNFPRDLTKITTPFGLLNDKTREALRAHGGPYEYLWSPDCDWVSSKNPAWCADTIYRVAPATKRRTEQ